MPAKRADDKTARPRKTAAASTRGAGKTSAASGDPAHSEPVADGKVVDGRAAEARFPIVGIGASAGGLEAYDAFFSAMPPDSGMAFVLVTHLDPSHVSLLPELIQKKTRMVVRTAEDGLEVEPNAVYVIPPNRELGIFNGALQLMDLSQPRGANLPIDVFLRSLARDQGANAICIILSGTGTDGSAGLKAVKGEAGMVMVQSEESAKYDGMPRSAIATGLADYVLPPEKMPEKLIAYTRHAALAEAESGIAAHGPLSESLAKIFMILRSRTEHDFSLYKVNTIRRRIERRMSVHQIDNISEYVRYLQESDREARILFKDLLIGVTSFFRDPDAYGALKTALPELLRTKPQDGTVRVWVPGCASGEEAYSIAIVLCECLEELKHHLNVQVFGTDIDEDAIAVARAGLYPASIVADVSPKRLKRYFAMEDDGRYRIKKPIREMLVFAVQNIIKDPPFTKIDLISCRNLLIYLGPELQRKLMPVFHYSLLADGLLFLGSSETIGHATDLFKLLDKKWKVFRRKSSTSVGPAMLEFPAEAPRSGATTPELPAPVNKAEEISTLRLVEAILLESTTPPTAVVDERFDVVYIHGRTGEFLEPVEGRVSVNLVEMARPGLRMELAAALRKAASEKRKVVCRSLRVQQHEGVVITDLTVTPMVEQRQLRGLMLVTFEKQRAGHPASADDGVARVQRPKDAGVDARTVAELEKELTKSRESLQTTIEELETSNEELKSTNEELQSTNEELQSTNEELETSKEELQSLNEESATVNAELQARLDELAKANDDMKNLLDSTDVATIFLDTELRVRRFTPRVTRIIPLAGTDIDRPIAHFASKLKDVDLGARAEQVLEDLAPRELQVDAVDGRSYMMRMRPYRTTQNVIDGVVITLEDITWVEESAATARRFFESIVDTVREPLVVLDVDRRVVSASRSFYRVFEVEACETEGQSLFDLGNGQWDIGPLRALLAQVIDENKAFDDFTVEQEFPNIGHKVMYLNARQMHVNEETRLVLLAIENRHDR